MNLRQTLEKHPPKLPQGVQAAHGGSRPGFSRLVYAASEEAMFDVPDASAQDVDEAVARANEVFETGPWRTLLASERADRLAAIADAIIDHLDELAILHTFETGIPIAQTKAMHIPRTAENFRFFGQLMTSLAGESYEQTGRYLSIVTREPIGVGALIAPWNAPLVLGSMKLAAAIALGNSIIVKPSEYAPLSLLRLVEIAQAAGLPEGVAQVVCGPGATTGAALVKHSGVHAIGFIGGTATGRRIMMDAAAGLKKVGLELGGKSASIVLESADFDRAIDGTLMGFLANNGEQCLAGTRLLVEQSIADRFIDALVSRVEQVRLGDPFETGVELGPLAFKAHFDRVMSFATQARQDSDYRVLTGAEADRRFDKGLFFKPTVVEARDNASALCQDEIFGPFLTIQRIRDLDDAIGRANDSEFGLAAYVWSDDLPSVMKARRELRAGTIWVNTPMARDLRAPFGGYDQSGIGRDGLPGSIELFTEEKTTMIPQSPIEIPRIGIGEA